MNIVQLTVGNNSASLTGYLHTKNIYNDKRNIRPSIVLCPGGAYSFVSDVEKDPVALYYFAKGMNVFTLDYSVGELASDLTPLLELSEALTKIRDHSIDFRCDPTKIAVMGFSAGGHLAASLGLLYSNSKFQEKSGIFDDYNSPDALILSYPVISTGEFAHQTSVHNVTGDKPELVELLSLENRVTSKCPPVFLWTTQSDETVPVQNSISLLNSLIESKVSVEFHLFPNGEHGLSMCTDECNKSNESVAQWKELSIKWLSDLFNFQLV
jgi:acetyl esterase/lipase